MGRAATRGVGETILASVRAARQWTRTNTNLGIVLLFAPLAKAALTEAKANLRARLSAVLRGLTVDDARAAYEGIRLAAPGGLEEKVEREDVRDEPGVTLREAMGFAAERDSIASEYCTDYTITFERTLPALLTAVNTNANLPDAVVQTYLDLLAAVPDTLIARKRGRAEAQRVSGEAARIVDLGGVTTEAGRRAIEAFDAELRRAGNRLNPGTTADLVAAALFTAALEGRLLIGIEESND
jgi:triphosphoribosyl-dephospho-CoA synthase